MFDNPVKAPVLYRARDDRHGVSREGKAFYGYDKQHKDLPKFAITVKEIADKDFTSFQGKYQQGPKGEPFLVPPKEKK